MVMRIDVKNQKKFNKQIEQASRGVSDLRVPLTQIKKQWYQGNKSIFALRGPGKYKKLSPKYQKRKQTNLGFTYPLLRAENRNIEKAITRQDDRHAYSKISNKKSIELGVKKSSSFPYAFAIHYGNPANNTPARPYVLLGVEQVATKEQQNKTKVYINIIRDYIVEMSGGFSR